MTAGPGTVWQKQQPAPLVPPVWVQVGNVVGPAGRQGPAGSPGQPGQAAPSAASLLPLRDKQFADVWSPAASITTTSASFVNVTGFNFPVQANEVWTCEVYMFVLSQNSGVKWQWTGPGSPTVLTIINQGALAGEGGIQTDAQTAFSSASALYASGNGANNFTVMKINLFLQNGANAGIVQLQFEAGTGGDTTTVEKGSYMSARRIA